MDGSGFPDEPVGYWHPDSGLADFMRLSGLVLCLAMAGAGFRDYLALRYDARAAQGLVHVAMLSPGDLAPEDLAEGDLARADPELASVLRTIRDFKSDKDTPPRVASLCPNPHSVAIAPEPKKTASVQEPSKQLTPPATACIASPIAEAQPALASPLRTALEQPPLKLQPGLREEPDVRALGERIWLSSTYAPEHPRLTTVAAAGDVMMGSAWPSRSGLNPDLTPGVDPARVLGGDLAEIFRGADVSFVNLEGPLYDGTEAPAKACANCFAFRSPESYASILAGLGIDVVSLANNHSGNFGLPGRNATLAALRNAGISFAGLDRDDARTATLVLPSGKRVGVVAFAPNGGTLSLNDAARAETLVRALRTDHDLVIVSFHGGAEGWDATHVPDGAEFYMGENRGDVQHFAHRMIDAGASMVLGHGPHVPRAMEIYRGHLVAYSLGNFWTYGLVNNYAVSGLGPVVETWLAPDGTIAGVQIRSTRQAGLGVPHIDPLNEAARYMRYLTEKDFPATEAALSRNNSRIAKRDGAPAL